MMVTHEYSGQARKGIFYNLLNLAFSILMGISMERSEADFVEARTAIDTDDFKLLSQDPKALHLLEESHRVFIARYKLFAKLRGRETNT